MATMTKDYEPPPDAAKTFAQYKEHYEGERDLKPQMTAFADRELLAGATVGQLAKLTGLTPEVFRRRARALGVELKRPPTVGKLAAAKDAEPRLAAVRPTPVERPARAPREPAAVVPMTDERAEQLVSLARERATAQQWQGLEQRTAHVGASSRAFAVVAEALGMGLLSQPEADGDTTDRPDTQES